VKHHFTALACPMDGRANMSIDRPLNLGRLGCRVSTVKAGCLFSNMESFSFYNFSEIMPPTKILQNYTDTDVSIWLSVSTAK
jgi:hypothetical protein